MRYFIGLSAACLLLAGCGGGGGNETTGVVTPTPSPTPAPTPTPTPAPTPAVLATGEVKPAADAAFIAASLDLTTSGDVSDANGTITGGMTSNRATMFDTPQFRARYDAGYALSDAVNAATFGPAQLVRDTTTPDGNGTVQFTRAAGPVTDYLVLYQNTTYTSSIKGAGYTTARYGGVGAWQHSVASATTRATRVNYFAFGSPTPVSAMPRSGVVEYSVLSAGNYATDTELFFLPALSPVILKVDFATGEVSGNIGLGGANYYRNETGGIGFLLVNGRIAGNAVTGPLTATLGIAPSVPGRFRLLFVGPAANELILTYVAENGDRAAVGAMVGVVDPFRQF